MTGGVGTDPEYRLVAGGRPRTKFRLASDVRRRNAEGEWETVSTSWYTVTCWGGLAKNVHASIEKGQRVVVHGRLHMSEYTNEQGQTRITPEINADAVGHDLTFATATIERRAGRDARADGAAEGGGADSAPLDAAGPASWHPGPGIGSDAGLDEAVPVLEGAGAGGPTPF